MDLLNMLNFNDYIQVNRLDYDMEYVRKNFYKVQGILGEENKDDTIAAITINIKFINLLFIWEYFIQGIASSLTSA